MPRGGLRDAGSAATCLLLPALTSAACRTIMMDTNTDSVESHINLFVFHLVVHLGISMVKSPLLFRTRAALKCKSVHTLPRSTKNALILQRHVRKWKDASHSQTGPFRSPFPQAQCSDWWWKDLMKEEEGGGGGEAHSTLLQSVRRQEAGQTPQKWI